MPGPRKNTNPCPIDDCPRPIHAKGYCATHYKRLLDHGDAAYVRIRILEPCDFEGCENKRDNRRLCSQHYYEKRRDPSVRSNHNVKHLFEAGQYLEFIEAVKTQLCKVDENNCWIWQKSTKQNGKLIYGTMKIFTKLRVVHRVMKSASLGGIDFGKEQIHHICAKTLCVNPDHLQRLTQQENIAEMQERTFYKNRIIELEESVVVLEQKNILLQKELDQVRMGESN